MSDTIRSTDQVAAQMIDVICARVDPTNQPIVRRYCVPLGTTATALVRQTDAFQQEFSATPVTAVSNLPPMGIFSRKLSDPDSYILQDQDRLELYQPLILTPMDVRRARARVYPVGKRKPRPNDYK